MAEYLRRSCHRRHVQSQLLSDKAVFFEVWAEVLRTVQDDKLLRYLRKCDEALYLREANNKVLIWSARAKVGGTALRALLALRDVLQQLDTLVG